MKRDIKCTEGLSLETGRNNLWKLLGPGGGGGQFIPTISPHDPDTILVACDMNGSYITKDRGRTWRQFNLRSRVDSFAFDPTDPMTIYSGSTGLFRSTDGGRIWSLIFPNPVSGLIELMKDDEADYSYISEDNWPGGNIQAIEIDEADNRHLCLGISTDNNLHIFHSIDCGRNWLELHKFKGSRIHNIYSDSSSPQNARRLFVFADSGAAVISLDDSTNAPMKMPAQIKNIIHSACGNDPASGAPLFYITAWEERENGNHAIGMWKSENGGESWSALEITLGGTRPFCEKRSFTEYTLLAVPKTDGTCIYAGIGGTIFDNIRGYTEIPADTGSGSIISYFGVIKSSDGGKSWTWVLKSDYANNPENLKSGWAERDYDMPWFGTGPKGIGPIGLGTSPVDPDICCYTDLSSTFLTTDGGISWEQIYTDSYEDGSVSTRGMDVTTCYGVHFDPFDRDHIAISYTDIGVFHSKNRGRTWFHALDHVPVEWGNTCYWLVFDPDVMGRVWSAWGGAHDLPRAKMFKGGKLHLSQGGVCRSEDGLATWHKSNKGMQGNSVTTHIILDPSSPVGSRTLYAAVFDKGVYKSVDDGHSWTLKNNGISENLNAWRFVILPDGSLFLLVARGKTNKKVVDGALYKSTDGADTWERVPLPEGVNAPNDMAFDPDDIKRMYLACWPEEGAGECRGGGVYATCDAGETWSNILDPAAYVYSVTVHPDNPAMIFAVTFNNAVYHSDNKGRTWSMLEGYDFKWGHRAVIDPYNKDMMYLTTFGSSVWYGPVKNSI